MKTKRRKPDLYWCMKSLKTGHLYGKTINWTRKDVLAGWNDGLKNPYTLKEIRAWGMDIVKVYVVEANK